MNMENITNSSSSLLNGTMPITLTNVVNDLTKQVFENQYLLTMLFYLLFGAIAGAFYYVMNIVGDLFRRTFVITVTVDNSGELFDWIVRWLGEQKEKKSVWSTTSSALQVYVKKISTRDYWESDEGSQDSSTVEFLPGPGSHMITYNGKTIWCSRSSAGKVSTVGYDNKPFVKEVLSLSAYGRDHTFFTKLFTDARKLCSAKDNDKTKIYVLHEYGYKWVLANAKDPRSVESVILDTNLADQIIQDASEFLSSQPWYVSVGLPYRRGYLLYGPPGCGKTSFVSALAAKLNLSICCLTLSSAKMNDQNLNERLHDAPGNAIILLEDIDSVFIDRNVGESHRSRVSFSGLLNAIDGVASQEGRLFFMTTNHIEKLDPALLRPGRTDVRCEFKRASKKQITEMFHRFYPESQFPKLSEKLVQTLVNSIPEYTVPMASLQEHFMRYSEEPEKAVNKYHEILNETKNDNSEFLLTADDQPTNTSQPKKGKKKKISADSNDNTASTEVVADELSTWLIRLGFSRSIHKFRQNKFYTVMDLSGINGNILIRLGLKATGDQERLLGMLAARKDVAAGFEYTNDQTQKRLFIAQFTGKEDTTEVEKYANLFAKNLSGANVSGHQIKDHLFAYDHNIKEAATLVKNLLNPPQDELLPEEALDLFNENQSIKSWITAENKFLYKLDKQTRDQIAQKLEEQEITTLADLLDLDIETDMKEIAKVEKKGHLLALKSAVEHLQKQKEKCKVSDQNE